MTPFGLKIVTPDGLIFDGQADKVVVRTTGGDVCILARHMDYIAPLGMGAAFIEFKGRRRAAACIGGMISVKNGDVTLVPTTFEWSHKIDVERAEAAYERAEQLLNKEGITDTERALARGRLDRALIRKNVGSYNK